MFISSHDSILCSISSGASCIEESKWKFVSVPIQNNPITDCIYNPAIELEPNIIPFNSIKFENQKNSVEFY